MSDQPYEYPEDLTGTSPGNLIPDEQHSVNPPGAMDQYFITPYHTPFFGVGLVITHVISGYELVEGVDFEATNKFIELSKITDTPVYGAISILNSSLNGNFSLRYQNIGGNLAISTTRLARHLNDLLVNPRHSIWGSVIETPPYFPPLPHQQDVADIKAMSMLVASIEGITGALTQRNADKLSGISLALDDNLFAHRNGQWLKAPLISSEGVNDTLISLRAECLSIARSDRRTLAVLNNELLMLKHDDDPYAASISPITMSGGDLSYLDVVDIDAPIAHYRLGDKAGFNFIGDSLTSSEMALIEYATAVVDGYNVITPLTANLQRVPLPPISPGAEYTFSYWVRPASLGSNSNLLLLSNETLDLQVGLNFFSGDVLVFNETSTTTNIGPLTQWFAVGTWTHVVFERYDSLMRVYINGVVVLSGLIAPTFNFDTLRVQSTVDFDGRYCDVRLEKKALYRGDTFTPPVQNTSEPIEMFIATDETGTYPGVVDGATLEAAGLLTNDDDAAMGFNGVDGKLEVLSSDFKLSDEWSIEFIINGDMSPEWINVVSKRGLDSAGYSFTLYIHNRYLQWTRSSDGVSWADWFPFTTLLQDNTTYHIVLTGIRNGPVEAYINGVRENTAHVAGDFATYVGSRSVYSCGDVNFPDRYLNGTLDEVAFYGYALTQSDVDRHYTSAITGVGGVGPIATYHSLVTASNPVALYRCDESTLVDGSTVFDSVGTNDAIVVGDAAPTLGLTNDDNTAIDFTANSSYVSITNKSVLPLGNVAKSIELLVSINSFDGISNPYVCYFGEESDRAGFGIMILSDSITFDLWGGGSTYAMPFDLDTVYHLVMSFDGTTLRGYINGQNVVSSNWTLINNGSTIAGFGAKYTATRFFNGVVDELAIYSYALTGATIAEHYEASIQIVDPTTLPNYHGLVLDDGAMTFLTLGDASGSLIAVDELGVNNGTYVNSPALGQTSLVPSHNDNSAVFDSSQLVDSIGSVSAFNHIHNTGIFSIEVTVRKDGTLAASQAIMGNNYSSVRGFYLGVTSLGAIRFYTNNNADGINEITQDGIIVPGQVNHIIVTGDGTHVRFYVNGIYVGGATSIWATVTTQGDATYPLQVGNCNGSVGGLYPWIGAIDDVSIYPTKLSAAQVVEHYNAANGPIEHDPYFENVVLLARMEREYDNTIFIDSSKYNHTLTAFGSIPGSTVTDTAIKKFGNASASFNNTPQHYLECAHHSSLDLNFEDFTIELHFRYSSLEVKHGLISYGDSEDNGFYLLLKNTKDFIFGGGDPVTVQTSDSTSVIADTWYHLAVVKSGGTITIYLDGINVWSFANNSTFSALDGTIKIGNTRNELWPWLGHIDDVRITKGVARYTANFTPPTQTYLGSAAADIYLDNVVSLLHMDGETGIDEFVDEVGNTWTSTHTISDPYYDRIIGDSPHGYWRLGEVIGSTIAIDETGSFNGTYAGSTALETDGLLIGDSNTAVRFDGTNSVVELGTVDVDAFEEVTVEAIIMPNDFSNTQVIFKEGGYVYGMALGILGGKLTAAVNANEIVTKATYQTSNMTLNEVYHVVMTVSVIGNVIRLFVNGVEVATQSLAGVVVWNGSSKGAIGSAYSDGNKSSPLTANNTSNETFRGVIDEVATYGYVLTPTQIAEHYDASIAANVTPYISKDQPKFGAGTWYWNQNVLSQITTPQVGDMDFGGYAGDWTVEMWAYPEQLDTVACNLIGNTLASDATAPASGGNLFMYLYSGGFHAFVYDSTGARIDLLTGTAVAINTWYHLAFVRKGNFLFKFQDGILIQAVNIANALFDIDNDWWIGDRHTVDGTFRGHIDDVRITKGVARYTSSFNIPMAAYPDPIIEPEAISNRPLEVINANGTLVAIFENNPSTPAIIRTTDSQSVTKSTVWDTPITVMSSQELRTGFYGNGDIVLFGYNGSIVVSDDARVFSMPTVPYSDTLCAGAYGNGIYAVVGESDVITSPDAINWSVLSLPFTLDTTKPVRMAYGNGIFILINGNTVYSCTDFTDWKTKLYIVDISDVVFGEYNGVKCFMMAVEHEVLTTINGTDLVSVNANGLRINRLDYDADEGMFVGGDINGKFIHASNEIGTATYALPIDASLR